MLRLEKFLITLPLIASVMLSATPGKTAESTINFKKYPVSQIYRGKPAPVDLSSPGAREYRTVLRNGAKAGPNFAGHYTVVTWGCGTACQSIAIVNARNGRVYRQSINASYDFKYQLNSKLLIANPPENFAGIDNTNMRDSERPRYYVWENNRLVQINPTTSNSR